MKLSKNRIQVFEHQTLKVGESEGFTKKQFKAMEYYGYRTKEKYYTVGNGRIKFSSYVGVIQVKNLTIEILPKADNADTDEASKDKWQEALIDMLKVCKLIKLDSINNAKLKLKSASVLDLYFDAFLTEAEQLTRHGLRKSYRNISENLNKVKGRILFADNIRKNLVHKERCFTEHKTYDSDNRLNQILLKALLILSQLIKNPTMKIRIKKLLLHFEDVEEKNVTLPWFENLRYNRNTERYKYSITLAKLIILRYTPDLRGGRDSVLAILFDMNTLFEEYIFRKLKPLQYDPNNPITYVSRQNPTPFWETRGLRADIVVKTETKNYVIDTKWKILKDNKPSDSDLKQMFVYDLHYDTDLSILLYPKTSLDTSKPKPFRNEQYKEKLCQVAFTEIFNQEGTLEPKLGKIIFKELFAEEMEIEEGEKK